MSDYVILTDATNDLPSEVIVENEIQVIPMAFTMDDHVYMHYPDEREMTCNDFYEKLKNGAMPTTSQINPVVCEEYMEEILSKGKDVLYIVFTTGLSGTYQSALIAKGELEEKYPDRKIRVVDSLCASVGEGLLVYYAAQMKKQGRDIDSLCQWIEKNKTHIKHWFSVDDLFHLLRGGRVSSVEAIVGSALRIKPILSVDGEGKLAVMAKVRGDKKSREYLISKVEMECKDASEKTIIVGHAANLEGAEQLRDALLERNLAKNVVITNIGPVIGTHVGQGMLAVTFLEYEE